MRLLVAVVAGGWPVTAAGREEPWHRRARRVCARRV